MNAPIVEFLNGYQREGMARFHMPGHKGAGPLGCEGWDLTEIKGADSLYDPGGIIARSEANAAEVFGTRRTFYSTEGSSQCVKAMLCLAMARRPAGTVPVVLAARNVHKAFVQATALLDLDVEWLWGGEQESLCECRVTGEELEKILAAMDMPPCAVYITSPDYLGNIQDVKVLAEVCHAHGTLLLVDNAHGAYLKLLRPSRHPMDLGADLCCDSAHKTLPVLTGGAYLHVGKNAPAGMEDEAKQALALFGSTSPSYLILASLDACNVWLAGEGPERVRAAARELAKRKERLAARGWTLAGDEPLKLTVNAAAAGWAGPGLADLLRVGGVEPEYADPDYVVLMASGSTTEEDFRFLEDALSAAEPGKRPPRTPLRQTAAGLRAARRAMTIRQATFSPCERVSLEKALGRVCAAPTVSCPPAVPIAVSGEVIGPEALAWFQRYGVESVLVVKE